MSCTLLCVVHIMHPAALCVWAPCCALHARCTGSLACPPCPALLAGEAFHGIVAPLLLQSYQTDWEAILESSPERFIASVSSWMFPPELSSSSGGGSTAAVSSGGEGNGSIASGSGSSMEGAAAPAALPQPCPPVDKLPKVGPGAGGGGCVPLASMACLHARLVCKHLLFIRSTHSRPASKSCPRAKRTMRKRPAGCQVVTYTPAPFRLALSTHLLGR